MASVWVAPKRSWIAELGGTSGAWRRRRPAQRGPTSRQLLLAVALGSVALVLFAASRRRRAAVLAGSAAIPAAPPGIWNVPPYSLEPPLRGNQPAPVHPVAVQPMPVPVATQPVAVQPVAVQPSPRALAWEQAAQLRRRALELLHRGRDAEAGLLDNYAVLLERSNVSVERVAAEVARLSREAGSHLAQPRHRSRSGAFRMPLPDPPISLPPPLATLTPRVPASLDERSPPAGEAPPRREPGTDSKPDVLARRTLVPRPADVRRRAGR